MQYYWWALNEWQPLQREPLAAGVEKLSFPADEQHPRGEAVTYLAQTRALNDTPWNLTLLSPWKTCAATRCATACWPPSVSPSWHSC